MRFFNIAGPVDCEMHYCLPPLSRAGLEHALDFIDQKKYFFFHAPGQSGKTTCLMALMDYLNTQGKYDALYFNIETAQAAGDDIKEGMRILFYEFIESASDLLNFSFTDLQIDTLLETLNEYSLFHRTLAFWARHSSKPVVLFMDEIEAVSKEMIISIFRQLRSGYPKRMRGGFPVSVILCGTGELRHGGGDDRMDSVTWLNFEADSLQVDDFSKKDIERLYACHTQETGQVFGPDALEMAWALSSGQPWLVNALGHQACFCIPEGRDRSRPITAEIILKARDTLVWGKHIPIDTVTEILHQERTRSIIEPMLLGGQVEAQVKQSDIQYLQDMGILRRDSSGLYPANPIYREIIPWELSFSARLNVENHYHPADYTDKTGKLNMERLLSEFQSFFREQGQAWASQCFYKMAAPYLLLQAFLQHMIQPKGRMDGIYGLGRTRMDMMISRPWASGIQQAVVSGKILKDVNREEIESGVRKLFDFMKRHGVSDGHLVLFYGGRGKKAHEKMSRITSPDGKGIALWGVW